jgi:hypothetical protein
MISNRLLNTIYIIILICGAAVMAWMTVGHHFVQWLDITTGTVFFVDMLLIRYLLPKDMNGRMGLYFVRLFLDLALIAMAVYLLLTYGNL